MAPTVLSMLGLQALIDTLLAEGYTVIGPTVRDGAIVLDALTSVDALPHGVTDAQDAGRYRLDKRSDGAVFGYAVGPRSLKERVFVPKLVVSRYRRQGSSFRDVTPVARPEKVAVLAARACDLAALAIQDRVFLYGAVPDPDYAARREALFIIAVQCTAPANTCFCVSMNTGPRAASGFDLALTELAGDDHRFLLEIGSARGEQIAQRVAARTAEAADVALGRALVDAAADQMGRSLDTTDLQGLLARNANHPHWEDVATRCVGCANCTLVCPTCFCSTVEEVTDLAGEEAIRTRTWDSCFTLDHSYVHGGPVRATLPSRYRQWLTHKLSTWIDQFDTSGCVGCGRCVTWCPVGIDLTAEVATLRAAEAQADD